MDQYYRIISYIFIGIVGLCVGSFLNVVIYRLPEGMSLAKPNSHCPKCKYELHWYDNIPIFSYLMLRGKCRVCKTHISFRYTIVEIVNMVLWLMCGFLFWEKNIPLACIYMVVCSIFICVFFIDIKHQIIFDRFQIMLLLLGIASILFDKSYGWLSHVLGGMVGFGLFFLVGWWFEKIFKVDGLGGGDIKLVGVVGLLLGWEKLLLALLVATIPASIIMLIAKKKSDNESKPYPFAPFLVSGFVVAIFFGEQIILWYLTLLGF